MWRAVCRFLELTILDGFLTSTATQATKYLPFPRVGRHRILRRLGRLEGTILAILNAAFRRNIANTAPPRRDFQGPFLLTACLIGAASPLRS